MKNKQDEILVKEYKSGNQQAFNELYARYKNLVKYYARNLFLLGLDHDDLIQEGFLGFVNATNTYIEGKSSFKTYLTACVKNSLYDAVKKSVKKGGDIINNSSSLEELGELSRFASTIENPEELFINNEKVAELKFKIYSNLSKREGLTLDLYLQGLSYAEIAQKLGVSTKSVDGALTRAKAKIKNCLGE